jgi:hypothetical protein
MKRLMLASILLLSLTLMLTSAPAWAVATVTATSTCKSVSGQTFSVAGSVKITVNFPDYATATITLPKLENVVGAAGETFVFGADGKLSDEILDSFLDITYFGTWKQDGCNIAVDFTYGAEKVVSALAELGIDAEIVPPTTTTAKISTKDGTNSGKLTIKINILAPYEGTLSIQVTFKGIPATAASKDSLARQESFNSDLKYHLEGIYSIILRERTAPKK